MENNEYFASINEVSKRLNVPAHTLRYWEKQFPVAIRPTTGAGGRRYYRADTVEKLIVIKDLLYTHGMTIAGVKKLLRNGNLPENTDELLSSVSTTALGAVTIKTDNPSVDSHDIDTVIHLLESARSILE